MPTLVEQRTPEDCAMLCGRFGLRFAELNMNFPEYRLDRIERTDELIRAAELSGIYYTIHLDENLDIADFNPLVSAAWLETVRRTIQAAKKLLCLKDRYGDPARPMILNMHMNHGVHITLPKRKVQLYERDADEYMASFAAFRSLCEDWIDDSDLLISIENTDGFRPYEREAIEYLLESPVFGLTWDIGHSKAAGGQDEPFLLAHRDRLAHFHIHDGTQCPPRDHLPLGEGEIDLAARLRLARECGARCVLETKTAQALAQSILWLQTNG